MPAALDVDREAVKVLVLTIGVREAARRMGLPESTVQSWSQRGQWLQPVVQPPTVLRATTATKTPSVALQDMLDAGKNPKLLSLLEKREYLASAVRTPIGQIDEESPLAHKIRHRTDKDGGVTREIESVPKLRALELDARLAGELESPGEDLRGLVAIQLIRCELPETVEKRVRAVEIEAEPSDSA